MTISRPLNRLTSALLLLAALSVSLLHGMDAVPSSMKLSAGGSSLDTDTASTRRLLQSNRTSDVVIKPCAWSNSPSAVGGLCGVDTAALSTVVPSTYLARFGELSANSSLNQRGAACAAYTIGPDLPPKQLSACVQDTTNKCLLAPGASDSSPVECITNQEYIGNQGMLCPGSLMHLVATCYSLTGAECKQRSNECYYAYPIAKRLDPQLQAFAASVGGDAMVNNTGWCFANVLMDGLDEDSVTSSADLYSYMYSRLSVVSDESWWSAQEELFTAAYGSATTCPYAAAVRASGMSGQMCARVNNGAAGLTVQVNKLAAAARVGLLNLTALNTCFNSNAACANDTGAFIPGLTLPRSVSQGLAVNSTRLLQCQRAGCTIKMELSSSGEVQGIACTASVAQRRLDLWALGGSARERAVVAAAIDVCSEFPRRNSKAACQAATVTVPTK